MTAWSWSVGDWRNGTPDYELINATGRTLNIRLLDPSDTSFTVLGDSTDALYITDLVSDVWVARNGNVLLRGRVTTTTDDIKEATYTLNVTAQDYRSVLQRRLLLDGDQTWTGVAQEQIVSDLLTYTQGKPGGNYGITQGIWPATGVLRTVSFKDGDAIWDSIKALTAMENGFEFLIDATMTANLYWPRYSGVDRGVTIDYGGAVRLASGTTDTSSYANVVRQSGGALDGTSITPTPVVLAEADIVTRPEGRWEANYGDTSLTTDQMVSDAAAYTLSRYGDRLNTSWTLTLAPGVWQGPGHIWIGDIVTYAVRRGRRDVVDQARVYELTITLDESNVETVSLVVGQIIPGERALIKRIAHRVAYLSKQ